MKKGILLILLFTMIFISCKKEEENNEPEQTGIFGKWKVIGGGENVKYFIITQDSVLFRLEAYGINEFRDKFKLKLSIKDDRIETDSGIYYYYTLEDDKLTFSYPGQSSVNCVRDNSAPDEDEWTKPVTVSTSMASPIDTNTDLTFDGQYLWHGNAYDSDVLYKINPDNLTVQTLSFNNNNTLYAWGISYVNGFLWMNDDGDDKLHKVDPSNGNEVFESSDFANGWFVGIAYDGQYLWVNSNYDKYLYKYDMNTDSVVSQVFADIGMYGMEYVGGYLYICARGNLHKCSLNPFKVEETYQLDNGSIYGVGYDGNNFWVTDHYYNENPEYRIEKISFN